MGGGLLPDPFFAEKSDQCVNCAPGHCCLVRPRHRPAGELRDKSPYNAALRTQPGMSKVKHLRFLAVLPALAAMAANAAPQAGTAGDIRERLLPFGQVCRTGEVCPAPASAPAAGGETWKVTDLPDNEGGDAGEQGVQSPWASSGIRWPETSASIGLTSSMDATMRFTHLELSGGEISRYGDWVNHWITLGVGERQTDFNVRLPSGSRDRLLLGAGPVGFLKKALEDQAGETLTVRLNYQGTGAVAFGFPLAGAAESLHAIGLVDQSVVDALARSAVEGAPAAAEPVAEAPAPMNALTAAAGTRSGQAIYDTFCFACHATGVSEAPLFGSLEQWQPRIDKGMDELVAVSLTGLNLMPPMGTCMNCTEDEMRDSIQYMIDNAL